MVGVKFPSILLATALVFGTFLSVQAKPIRLRNEVIHPKQKNAFAAHGHRAEKQTGLFLVQFRVTPGDTEREALSRLGAELLQFVPEDSFIARFRRTDPAAVSGLPFVEWVGEYRPEHKVHGSLHSRAGLGASKGSGKPVEGNRVTVILAVDADENGSREVRGAFARLRQEGKSRNGLVLKGEIHPNRLEALARSHDVLWIEPFHDMSLSDEVASKIVSGNGGAQQLLTRLYGFDGRGVTLAVADSGLHNGNAETMHPDLFGRTPAFFHYGTLSDGADEHSHGTHVAGIVAGNGAIGETDDNGNLFGLGVAPGADIIGQRLFDGSGGYQPPPSFEVMTHDATRAGAEIGSNSWGDDTQGRYDVSAMEFDELVRDADYDRPGDQQYILEFSAGNAGPGPQTIGSPAVAKNVIATGAAQNDRPDLYIYDAGPDAMADFSSRGPAEDGRIKPDIVAPGTWIASLQSGSATDQYAWSAISPNYQYQGGTSQAGPHASGAAAVFVQWYRTTQTNGTPSPALVKAALINTAVDMDDTVETGPVPNMDEGWGRLDLTPFIDPDLSFDFVDQSVALTNSELYEKRILLAGADAPLRITMTYTDVPGFPGAARALVNDLDLEVEGPDGSVYLGNQMADGESARAATLADTLNNVEVVILWAPEPGEYVVRVRGRQVVSDARIDRAGVNQDFALVISGRVPDPRAGTLFFNKREYRQSDQIKLTLFDSDLAGNPSAPVLLRSASELAGEDLLLQASGTRGFFTGMVNTATGASVRDGRLQLAHDDWIEARYVDASPGGLRLAGAVADFLPPVISRVATTNEFNRVLIQFATDESAIGSVWFGTSVATLQGVTNGYYEANHSVALPRLESGQTYYYQIVAIDEAGNVSTNSNGGALFQLVAPPANTALLVNAATTSDFDNDIPLTTYTTPLQQIGVTFDVWDTAVVGRGPMLSDLQPYRLIIWRMSDGVGTTDVLSPADQTAIREYLKTGGSFLMASMEQLTRLGGGGFRSDVLHIAELYEDTGVDQVFGIPNNSSTSGMEIPLSYTQHNNEWHDLLGVPDDISDTVLPKSDATPILLDAFGDAAGVQYPRPGQDSQGRVIFLAFPLDAVPEAGTSPNTRAQLLSGLISFLVPGANGHGTLTLDAAAYSVPSFVTVEMGDSSLAGAGSATVKVTTTTQPGGVTITVTETPLRGLFRGRVDLIAANATPSSGQLRASGGDELVVEYFDASQNRTIQAHAVVDVKAPTITAVTSTSDYESATISWSTDEASDSTVLFGESKLLGRTASDFLLTTSHEVTVSQLVPDKVYYYKVVSRDAAGNAREDDNGGQFYTVRTLKPLSVPWFDNLETGGTNWTVSSTDDTQVAWTLGTPTNELASDPLPSPKNAWGSNLGGQMIDYAESFLASPAVLLTNGNAASLRFKHNYDFTERSEFDIWETGQLIIVLPGTGGYEVLGEYGFDLSGGWIDEEYDLTPYVGKVVYFVWLYQVLSMEAAPRPGWLVDDVSVQVQTLAPGSIVISNNLWQASYVLSGKQFVRGNGVQQTLTNLPPGNYTITYNPVSYYATPQPITRTLASGGQLQFTGVYTLIDSNSNGISDEWENQYFGGDVSQPTQTDSDGDGMTDYSEFVAGTDPLNPPPAVDLDLAPLQSGISRLEWRAVPGKQYRIQYSTNLTEWKPYSDFVTATMSTMSFDLPTPTSGGNAWFRVEASTLRGPNDPPANLRVTATPQADGSVLLSWDSSPGIAYQVEMSQNGATWSTLSNWIRAGGVTTSFLVPKGVATPTTVYRLQARP